MKIITFGEIMLRLSPVGYYRLLQNDQMTATFGGGEANVAVSLANWGLDSIYITKVPNNPLGNAAVAELNRYGVNTSHIIRGGDRMGIYFLEKGASQRSSICVYDRAHSAISEAQPKEFNWDAVFSDAQWFHFTGITPALSPRLVTICKEACLAAKSHGVKVSCDLNYRRKLWPREKARLIMSELCNYVDICIANEEDAKDVFGISARNTSVSDGILSKSDYRLVAKELRERFGFEKVAITLRTSISASRNLWAGLLYNGSDYYDSTEYNLDIVDRVGGGDSFAAGLIYALIAKMDMQQAIDFAVAASALKHSIEGDFNRVSLDEIMALVNGSGCGRITR